MGKARTEVQTSIVLGWAATDGAVNCESILFCPLLIRLKHSSYFPRHLPQAAAYALTPDEPTMYRAAMQCSRYIRDPLESKVDLVSDKGGRPVPSGVLCGNSIFSHRTRTKPRHRLRRHHPPSLFRSPTQPDSPSA